MAFAMLQDSMTCKRHFLLRQYVTSSCMAPLRQRPHDTLYRSLDGGESRNQNQA